MGVKTSEARKKLHCFSLGDDEFLNYVWCNFYTFLNKKQIIFEVLIFGTILCCLFRPEDS